MFKSLKDKLKNWVSKNEDTEEVEEIKEDVAKPKEEKPAKKVKEDKKVEKEDKKEKAVKIKEEKKNVKIEAARLKAEEKEKKKEERKKAKEAKEKEAKESKEDTETPKDDLEEIVEDIKDAPEFRQTGVSQAATTEEVEDDVENAPEKKTKSSIFKKILTEEKFESMFEELEFILLQNNVAYDAVDKIKSSLGEKLIGNSLKDINLAKELRNAIEELLINPSNFIEDIKNSIKENSPFVILFSGINGAGKTTSIAKVAHLLQKNKLSVCLAAGDTFRAAAIQQLEEHANILKVPIIKKDYGADPASVGFDAIAYAKKHKIDVVLIDTAGRIQNKDTLMKEIEKIARVTKPDMKIFLGESITGNDATEQAKVFNETIGIDGIILSKADVDEKGGTAISVSSITGKPILFLGTGQKYEDLEVFDKEKLIEKLGL
jgi:fused signal recognition particle receptor